jgi:hypothetical protein
MRICDLSGGLSQLTLAFAQLKDRWEESQAQWNDATRKAFEKEHLQPLPDQIKLLMAAAQRLAETSEKVTKALADDDRET